MRKLIFVLTVLMSGCATPQTSYNPTTPPEMAGIIAGATQTSVYATNQAIANQQTATVQAAYIQQTAASYDATSTRIAIVMATETSQALETAVVATETAIYAPMALQQTQDAQSVLMARQNGDSTATAVYTMRQIEQDAKRAVRNDKWWTIFQNFVIGIMSVIVLGGLGIVFRKVRPLETIFDDHGNAVAIDPAFNHLPPPRRQIVQTFDNAIPNTTEPTRPPVNNMSPIRNVKWNQNNTEQVIPVTDTKSKVTAQHWMCLARALLVDGVGFNRDQGNGVVKNTFLNQGHYNALYAEMKDQGMVTEGILNKLTGTGYQYLYDYLSDDEKSNVILPHPEGLTPVSEGVN